MNKGDIDITVPLKQGLLPNIKMRNIYKKDTRPKKYNK